MGRSDELRHIVYLSLGTNLGDKERNLNCACSMLEQSVGKIMRRSSMIETEPWGYDSPNSYLNMCVKIETLLEPLQLLDATQEIERRMGRTEKTINKQYHDRIIDIDILYYDDLQINTERLTIPHPLIETRDFVLKPLKEVITSCC
ncbi:MAG: 2-amino-4-hydroxy-6-hydroxymethyldihydropteridine diphosphokinase [Paludibacteraceae bacterium]|nr:2-amino-4-hydroxy-6-hydroxymethyldihydropteridine diphosphokinase [Paludibacteraceae bacterium]